MLTAPSLGMAEGASIHVHAGHAHRRADSAALFAVEMGQGDCVGALAGITELREEGAVQVLWSTDDYDIDPVLAAVGQLQFEVVASRLQSEYGVDTKYETMPYEVARWIKGGWPVANTMKGGLFNSQLFKDGDDRPVLLCKNMWALNNVQEKFPDVELLNVAPL